MSRKMPKTEKTVLNWIKDGQGQGDGKEYKPFFTVRFSSLGRTWAIWGLITDREHHYLSDLEYKHHFLIEFTPGVKDMREQFAHLPWEEPQHLAKIHGIRYPRYPGTTIPIVQTSDIVVTIEGPDGPHTHVFSIKYYVDIDLNTEDEKQRKKVLRTLQLLFLEKEYWRARGAHWHLCTDRTLPAVRSTNLEMFHSTMLRRACDDLNPMIPDFTRLTIEEWIAHPFCSLNHLLEHGARTLEITIDDSFNLMGRSIWTHLLPIDLDTEPIHHLSPVLLISR